MKQIILDTNFLVYCAENKIDYAEKIALVMSSGHELVVPSLVIWELNKIKESAKKYSDKKSAELALKLLEHNKIRVIEIAGRNADEAIISMAEGNIVATLDFGLRKKLKGKARILVVNSSRELDFA